MTDLYEEMLAHMQQMESGVPFLGLLGIQTEALGKGYARLRLPVEEKHLNWRGLVHGGVICTLVDMAASRAVRTLMADPSRPPPWATLEMNVTFLRPGRGPFLLAEGRALFHGRTVAVGDVTVYGQGQQAIAQGRATFLMGRRDEG